MNDTQIETLDQVRRFLEGVGAFEFEISDQDARYVWICQTLIRFGYRRLPKADKGLLLSFIQKVSGYSRIRVKPLVNQYLKTGRLERRQRTARGFSRKYTLADIRLLARTDELNATLSGPATKKLCERAWAVFGQSEYERLEGVSVAHLYNLRRSTSYTAVRRRFDKTRPRAVAIGERRRPEPGGKLGYPRVDTVHQGDQDGVKGVYHVNAVDAVTQFEIVCAAERIGERYLLPVLAAQLERFPFEIQGFHGDNGSEYINRHVAKLLNKLLVEFTKSRSRHSNDNALVECKNGAVIRKHMDYCHIAQRWAPAIGVFFQDYLNPYVNFHRPCFFPVVIADAKGKQRKTYPFEAMTTPWERFKSLPNAPGYLKPATLLKEIDDKAQAVSDNEAGEQPNEAKRQLFKTISEQDNRVA